MYEALIARVRYHIQKANFMGLKEAESTLLLNETADAIEKLLTERNEVNADSWKTAFEIERDEHRWISVKEQLPEIDKKHHCSKDVLAYLKGGGMCFTALEENFFGKVSFECERNPAVEEEMIVTHWMPLPQAPKEK